ncbi:Solute carrier organic anion transporter family member [Aphelenchoides fujianensis]|nr:Solute carrier organic anion transporter family member [Aphelenchoides fujianensis]
MRKDERPAAIPDGAAEKAETRSVPGDLSKLPPSWCHRLNLPERPGTSQGTAAEYPELSAESPIVSGRAHSVEPSGGPKATFSSDTNTPNQNRKGHRRGNRDNGFASAPPFPRKPNREAPWTTVDERQKRQQLEFIDKEIDTMAEKAQCGIGNWRPQWMQRFATRNWMLLWLCWFCTIQGIIVNGLVPSTISTIERRFSLSTTTIARTTQFYDFGYVLFCIPVSYFGGRHSKPLALAIGMLLMATGAFMFSTPHLLADSYTNTYSDDDAGLSRCHAGDSPSLFTLTNASAGTSEALHACPSPENQSGTLRYVFFFCLAHFLHGIGATPLFTIGVSYIDENVGPALSSLYLGVFYAFAIFGPALGFLASSTMLRYHTDFLQTGKRFDKLINLDESDPKWVGAWWVSFQFVSVLALIAVIPILALPKVLPESLKWHRKRLRDETIAGAKKRTPECCGMPQSSRTAAVAGNRMMQLDDQAASNAVAESMPALKARPGPLWFQLWLDVRHIPIAIYRILSNGPYMLISLSMAVDGLIITGASTFMSKYLERQFGVAPSKANMLIGAIMVPMAGIGTMMSGFIVQHFRLSSAKTIQFCIILLISSLLLSPMYFIYCDHDLMVGVERPYAVDDEISNHYNNETDSYVFKLSTQCNAHCKCELSEYHPVCAEFDDGSQMAFYSPCYAGCPENYNPLSKYYKNCTCAPTETKGGFRRVKKGYCESKCRGLFFFLILFAPFCALAFSVGVPLITVVLRTVDYAERAFALGIQWILVRVIGTIPAPVLFGWLFDVSCIRQHFDPCSGENGSCMLYQNKMLADLFLAFSVAGQLVAIVCLVCVLMFFSSALRDDELPMMTHIEDTVNRAVDGEEDAPPLFEGQRTPDILYLKSNLPSEIEPMLADKKKRTVIKVHD